MRTDFTNYVFRSHMVGQILSGIPKPLTPKQNETYIDFTARRKGEGRPLTDNQTVTWADLHSKATATPVLTDGVKKILKDLVFSEMFGRRKKVESKFLTKGVVREEDAISLYSHVTGRLYIKNKQRKSNEHFSGECDINTNSDTIDDIKTSWSIDSFPAVDEKLTSSDYRPQGLAYLDLWNKKRYRVAYCLVDTPDFLVERELNKLYYEIGAFDINGNKEVKEEHIEDVKDTLYRHVYTRKGLEDFVHSQYNLELDWFDDFIEIPETFRVKVFEFDRDDREIADMKVMVELARVYMNEQAELISKNGLEMVVA